MENTQKLVEEHRKGISIKKLAKQFHLSQNTISKKFKILGYNYNSTLEDEIREECLKSGTSLVGIERNPNFKYNLKDTYHFKCANGHDYCKNNYTVYKQGIICPYCKDKEIRKIPDNPILIEKLVKLHKQGKTLKFLSKNFKISPSFIAFLFRKASYNYPKNRKGFKFSEERIRKILKSVCSKPNKFETRCMGYLNIIYPNKFIYTGDGSFIVNGRSADAYSKELKIIYLFNGIYWHLKRHGFKNTESAKGAIELIESMPFIVAGYKVKFIWEDELNKELQNAL
jgi:lambda repressor-like predicted transcriptional regulator